MIIEQYKQKDIITENPRDRGVLLADFAYYEYEQKFLNQRNPHGEHHRGCC